MTDSRRYGYTKQSIRCVCMIGPNAHEQHGKPKNQTGKHLDPRCEHSELYNTLVRFPAIHAKRRLKMESKHPQNRHVGN